MSFDITQNGTRLFWEATYEWTTQFINDHPELKVGAEIGVAGGQHLKALLDNTKVEKLYGIDPYLSELWDMHDSFDIDKEYDGFDGLYEKVLNMLKPYGDRVELIRKKSIDVAPDFEDGCLDFVFIDGFHDYENCSNDIAFWHHRVRDGGYIMGHDWEQGSFPGVQRAVVDHYGDSVVGISEPFHIWYVQK